MSESGGAITAAARGRSQVLYAAAGLSVAAALLHFWVTPEHFEEWWGYGAFFLSPQSSRGHMVRPCYAVPAGRS